MSTQTPVQIDGSMLEGGGQILRMSAALAALTGTPVTVNQIRAGRAKPGLANQHLTGLRLIQAVCQGSLEGGAVRSSTVTLAPGACTCGTYTADIETAGAISLLIQAVLPVLLFARPLLADTPTAGLDEAQGQQSASTSTSTVQGVQAMSKVTLKGGTDAAQAPPISYVTSVLQPLLQNLLGLSVTVDLKRRGFYPRGGGEVHLTVQGLPDDRPLPAINLTNFGHVVSAEVHAFTAGRVSGSVGRAMADAALTGVRNAIRRHGRRGLADDDPFTPDLTCEVTREGTSTAEGDGGGVSVVVRSSTGCVLGANALADKDLPAAVVGAQCAKELEAVLACGACVDPWMQDQLIVYMALAEGTCHMLTTEPSLHCRTAMVVAEKLTTAKFTVTRPSIKNGFWRVTCVGCGLTPGSASAK